MLSDVVVDNFLKIFPVLAFGKIWHCVKINAPTRPRGDDRGRSSIVWVVAKSEYDIHPNLVGVVYVIRGGKAVYWALQKNGETTAISKARYIMASDPLGGAVGGWLTYDKLGPLGKPISIEDQRAVLRALHSKVAAEALIGWQMGR